MGRNSLAEQRRIQIIQAFYRCVAEDGLPKASMRRIAQKAGVQPSALHHYFRDRDEMIEAMVEHYTDTFFSSFLEQMNVYEDPETRFEKAAEFLFSPAMINEEASSFFYDCCAEARNNPRVRRSLAKLFQRFRAAIIEYFSQLEPTQGHSREAFQDIATLIIAVHEGVEMQWHMNPEDVSLERSLALAKQLMEIFLRGVTPLEKRRTA